MNKQVESQKAIDAFLKAQEEILSLAAKDQPIPEATLRAYNAARDKYMKLNPIKLP